MSYNIAILHQKGRVEKASDIDSVKWTWWDEIDTKLKVGCVEKIY